MKDKFYDEPSESSKVKTRIVEKYFKSWTDIIVPRAIERKTNIGYVDLFAGPGIYDDGSKSTPILILEQALKNDDIYERLVSVFNDVDSKSVKKLETSIKSIQGIDSLKNQPIIENTEIGTELTQLLGNVKGIPTLYFVDPWGYKGLSLELISSALKNWGCDCIFFFNYNRINMGINNPTVEEYMDALFGPESAVNLRNIVRNMTPSEREATIVKEIAKSLNSKGGEYVQSFCFKTEDGRRSSHYLIFVSKDRTGHKIMKEIMAVESTFSVQGVPSFEHNPRDSKDNVQLSLFDPLDELAELLLREFAGRTLTRQQVYDQHSVGTNYIDKNYRDVLIKLEAEGKIQTNPPADVRPKRKGEVTFAAKKVKVTFPPIDN